MGTRRAYNTCTPNYPFTNIYSGFHNICNLIVF